MGSGLSLLLTGFGGHDTNVLADQAGGGSAFPQAQVPGEYGGGAGNVNYMWQRSRTTVMLGGFSTARYYTGLESPLTHAHSAVAGVSFGMGRSVQVSLRQSASYASFYRLSFTPRTIAPLVGGPLPGGSFGSIGDLPSPDQSLAELSTIGTASSAEVIQSLGSRTALRYYYDREQTNTASTRRRLLIQNVGASYRRQMTRYGGLRLGYGYQEADFHRGLVPPTQLHNIDIGWDYARPLSFSRRTNVGFSMGTQAFDREGIMFYRFQGTGHVTHQMGRTWEISATYDRGIQFIELVDEPMNADTFRGHAAGLLAGRRLQLVLDSGYTTGQLSSVTTRRRLETISASSSLDWALGRQYTLFASYSFYQYNFDESVQLPVALLQATTRHSVHGGVRIWLPLIAQRGSRGTR